jgi:CO/xanthine dehydrogenase FAD-binding subunit
LPTFDLLQPTTLTEALQMLSETPKAVPLAGGTNLLVNLRGGRETAETLLDLGRLDELSGIEVSGSDIVIGAMTTVAELRTSPVIAEQVPLLREACGLFAAPLVRNRATIGGNLVDASPAADLAPPLLALDAKLELRSVGGRRLVPIGEFFVSVRETVRRQDELLTAIRLPVPAQGERTAYRKLGLRKADAISVVSAAVKASFRDDGVCESVRIALGAVAPTPIRAWHAEATLKGTELTTEAASVAAKLAGETSQPIDDVRGSAEYRRREVEVLVRRCLSRLMEANGGEVNGG